MIAACTMSGTARSMPYIAVPLIFNGTSSRAIRWPMNLNASGVLIAGSLSSLIAAASAASSPKRKVRPVGLCVTLLIAAAQSCAGTFQRFAAAAISRSRALAPACWTIWPVSRTARLPPVLRLP